ncbi:MAG: glycoside hydrolase family 127 protein [Thermoguttaceae bacterium]|nr:glycoside hydrolase family 127 protein [Thermoguttaceae bacterium]
MQLTRRTFLLATALLSAVRPDLLFADGASSVPFVPKTGAFGGEKLVFAASNDVGWGGFLGARYQKSLDRLSQEPIDKVDFVLADVNFNQERRFTNYSGDISGRYIEIASLASRPDRPVTPILPQVIDEIVQYQKPDGHFGRDVDWDKPIDIAAATDQSLEMPILWGNGRLILGLFAAYERFGNEKALDAAVKMADFYVNIVVKRFCDPARMDEYKQQATGYAAAYVTCVYHGIEGLVRAYRVTGKAQYLETAKVMADFHEQFDTLPVGHSHGSISAHEALIMLYEETGDKKYLDRVANRWTEAVSGGYVNPCGGVSEKYEVSYPSDEGCSEADWMRLNLMLWRNTKEAKYLDFAERMLYNAYQANQWATGGFGHRHLGVDDKGPFSWKPRYAESYWCCSYHGPLGYYELKEFLAVGAVGNDGEKTIYFNFPTLEFDVPLDLDGEKWNVSSRPSDPQKSREYQSSSKAERVFFKTKIKIAGPSGKKVDLSLRIPDWTTQPLLRMPHNLSFTITNGRCVLANVEAGAEFGICFAAEPILEDRRFNRVAVPTLEAGQTATLPETVLRLGPNVLVSKKNDGSAIEPLAVKIDADGKLVLPAESLTSVYEMTDAERDGAHAFVFNV